MRKNIYFIPRYIIYYCMPCMEKNWTVLNDGCLSGGRYCSPDPDGEGPLIGRDTILEDLRQLCIYQLD